MKIRSHLVILVLGAVLPILVFSAAMTAIFWREQRRAFEQRFLERVRAMSIALDAELDRYIGVLDVLGKSPFLRAGNTQRFYQEANRVRYDQLVFTNIILTDSRGRELANVDHPLSIGNSETPLPPTALRNVVRSGEPAISTVLRDRSDGSYYTMILSPVKRGDAVAYVLAAVVKQSTWLDFLSDYPMPRDAFMTLLDQNGVVIARTLNNQRWVGKKPAPALYEKSRSHSEGAYRSSGLEGQTLYSAHRRSARSGWTVATGVPQEGVEAILRDSTYTMAAGALAALLLAIWLAVIFGRRIAQPVSNLAQSARSIPAGGPVDVPSNDVTEVGEVAQAIVNAREELQARDAALRESEERFRLLTNLMPGVVWTADPDGATTFANDRWYAYTGLTPERNADDWPRLVVHPDDYQRWLENWKNCLRDETAYEIEVRYRRNDGAYRWWLSRAVPVKGRDGKVSSWYGFRMDIHEMKEAKDALHETSDKLRLQAQELEQQLIASGRLVSLGEITASMAHEFNNPLGIIMGFAQDLLSDFDSESPQYQSLKIIDEETRRCQKIIQDLLQYARPRNTELVLTDVKQTIDKTLTLVATHLSKQNIEAVTHLHDPLPNIYADPQQLEQVLVNLYLNAVGVMHGGGKLTVKAYDLRSLNETPSGIVIEVSDTGAGIETANLEKIFQPFFTANKARGLGLGLPICARIVKNHGGSIEVKSKPGKGTTFKIALPLGPNPSEKNPLDSGH